MQKPNLLIIHTDEHHRNTLGCYGSSIVDTPNIDRLAENGALCTNFYATSPTCTPSRAALLTGCYPQHTDATNNSMPLDHKAITFAEILKREGYRTGYAGKWHLAGNGRPQWAPKNQFGFEDNRFMFNRGHWKRLQDTPSGPKAIITLNGADEKSYATDWLADKAIDFIKANRHEPFCYMISIPDPHGINIVRKPYKQLFKNVEVPIPATFRKTPEQIPKWGAPDASVAREGGLRRLMPPYYGMVKCIDDNVGKIFNALEKYNLLDNTIIIFTADHGDLCGEHGRLNKGVPYEGCVKIPFVAHYPPKIKSKTVIHQTLSCIDFLPTFIHLMGFKTAGKEQGRDACAFFDGRDNPPDWDNTVFLRGISSPLKLLPGSWLCIISHPHKLIYSPMDQPWLYDLVKDPDELENRFEDPAYYKTIKQLTKKLWDYCIQYEDPSVENPKVKAEILTVINNDS